MAYVLEPHVDDQEYLEVAGVGGAREGREEGGSHQ